MIRARQITPAIVMLQQQSYALELWTVTSVVAVLFYLLNKEKIMFQEFNTTLNIPLLLIR